MELCVLGNRHRRNCGIPIGPRVPPGRINQGQVLQRYYGWHASRARSISRRAGTEGQQTVYAAPVPVPLHEARRRRAELLQRIFQIEPLKWPRCGQTMRIVGFVTEPQVIDRILDHFRSTAATRRRRQW